MTTPSESGGRQRLRPPPVDVLAAVLVTALALVEIWVEPIFDTGIPGPQVPLSVIVTVSTVPLALRRLWPLTALLGYAACLLAVAVVGDRDQSTFELFLGMLLVVHAVATQERARTAAVGAAVILVAGVLNAALTYTDGDTPADAAVPFLFIGGAWVMGREMRYQRQQAAQLAERAKEDERARIARDLHDVVAHGVSVMGLQAGGARTELSTDHPQARDALLSIEETSRATLDELHRMLGVLRSNGEDVLLAPAPRLDRLDELFVAGGRRPRVRLSYVGTPRPLPSGLELSAYRIVQEAVTNGRRHSRAEQVWVEVDYGPDVLTLRIRDDGEGAPERWEAGHGVIGMRERVALHGGVIDVGNGPDRGFTVIASLPIAAR